MSAHGAERRKTTATAGGPVEPEDMRESGPGIFYVEQPFVLVDQRVVGALKAQAARLPVRRARLCAHPSPSSAQHDMLIVVHRDSYIAPHRHIGKSETFLILEGAAQIILFDEAGGVAEIVRMGAPGSGDPFFYRMPEGLYHALSLTTELLVYVESTSGPFDPAKTEYAQWAPSSDVDGRGHAYLAGLLERKA